MKNLFKLTFSIASLLICSASTVYAKETISFSSLNNYNAMRATCFTDAQEMNHQASIHHTFGLNRPGCKDKNNNGPTAADRRTERDGRYCKGKATIGLRGNHKKASIRWKMGDWGNTLTCTIHE